MKNHIKIFPLLTCLFIFTVMSNADADSSYRKAAEQGDANAQYYLGHAYANGNGVSENDAEAVKWYRKAAEQGHVTAQYCLGQMYDVFSCSDVQANEAEAVKWYRKAAEQGHADAQINMGCRYYSGFGVTQNYTESVKWYRKAAEQGLKSAQYYLGEMYETGSGVSKNEAEAVKWYRKAAEQGYWKAKKALTSFDLEPTEHEMTMAVRRDTFFKNAKIEKLGCIRLGKNTYRCKYRYISVNTREFWKYENVWHFQRIDD